MSRDHVIKYLDAGLRMDGRKKDDVRKVKVTYGVSKSAEGSAEVTMGGTRVIAGVKMGMQKPYPDRPDEGGLMVSAELLPLSSPKFEPGPPSIVSIELARVVDRGIRESKTIDAKSLCVEEGEKAWFVTVDVCSINDDGNLLDASALAAIAALKDAKFPEYDEKTGVINYKKHLKKGLPISKEPIAVTVFKIGEHLILDPTEDEEACYDARLTITTLANGKACSLQKGGDTPLTIDEVDTMVSMALDRSKVLRKAL